MRIIALFNQKGGVGKTTTSVNLGAALAQVAGKKTVLIDLDPQANLTTHFGIDTENVAHTTYRVLTDTLPLADTLIDVPGDFAKGGTLRVAPATADLAAAEIELVSEPARDTILRIMAQQPGTAHPPPPGGKPIDADFILIDCPPRWACSRSTRFPTQPK